MIGVQQVFVSTHDRYHARYFGSPRPFVTSVTVDNRLPYAFVQIILHQHGYCTFVIILFGPFTRLFINLTMCIRALFNKSTNTLGLVEQAFWKVPLCTERLVASSFEEILARPSRNSSPGTFGSRCISLFLPRRRSWRRVRLCHFCTFFDYRDGNCNCLL